MKAKLLNLYPVPNYTKSAITLQLPKKDGSYWYLTSLIDNCNITAGVRSGDYVSAIVVDFKCYGLNVYKEA